MTAVITSINPFPTDVRSAFQAFIQDPKYTNRERSEYSKWFQLHVYLDSPITQTAKQAEKRLEHRAITEFQLLNNKLYRNPDEIYKELSYVVTESEVFDIIMTPVT